MTGLTVRQIDPDQKADARDWVAVPRIVHADDAAFVIQSDEAEHHRLVKKHNPYLLIASAAFFIAYREGKPVGRISGQYDTRLTDDQGQVVGQFGFADFIEDQAVADALLTAVVGWLQQSGAKTMRGPFNLSINQECGCLVQGFETAPAIMMPHARPWTGKMLERAGLSKAADLHAWRVDPFKVPERFLAYARREKDANAVVSRPLKVKELRAEFDHMGRIFNDGWRKNWGFLPFTQPELHHLADELKLVMRPDYGLFVEIRGEPVAVMMALPNINELVAPFKGRFGLFNSLRLLWQLKREKARTARVLVLGIKDQYQNAGLGSAIIVTMLEELIQRGRKFGLAWVEFSWVLETNERARNILRMAGAEPVKTYRIYEADLAAIAAS